MSLGKEGALLCVRIQDNGCGFEVNKGQAKGNKKPTMGLVDMQERTMFAGGAWLLKSTPNQGTEIEIRLPLVSPPI